jgi:hypothetical protein
MMTIENQRKQQHTYDMVAAHLLTQKEASKADIVYKDRSIVHECAYRGYNNLRCAVGFCIPNAAYHVGLEGVALNFYGKETVAELAFVAAVLAAIDPQYCNDRSFLAGLQSVHDYNKPDAWEKALLEFAKEYELDNSIVATMRNAQLPQPVATSELTAF